MIELSIILIVLQTSLFTGRNLHQNQVWELQPSAMMVWRRRGGETSPFWWESSLSSYIEVFSGGWEGCFPIRLWMDLDCYLHLCAKSHFQPHRAARFIFELSLTSWVFWWRTLKATSVWILYIFIKFYELLNSTKYISFKEPLLILLQSVHPNINNNMFMCLCRLN